MEALVLAAGKGTRMRGICDQIPKPMLPLANQPILGATVHALAAAGITRVIVVVGHMRDVIREHFHRNPPAIPIEFIVQKEVSGTGSATLLGKGKLEDAPFMMTFGDCILGLPNYRQALQRFHKGHCDAVLSIYHVPDPTRGASVSLRGDVVSGIIEKPPPGTAPSPYDNAGLFIFPPHIYDLLEKLKPSPRGEYELTDAIRDLMQEGGVIAAHEIRDYWFNLTDPETLLQANFRRLMESGDQNIVDPTAQVGKAVIGANVSIGRGCKIADGAALDNCILCENVEIGHNTRLSHVFVTPNVRVPANSKHAGSESEAVLLRA